VPRHGYFRSCAIWLDPKLTVAESGDSRRRNTWNDMNEVLIEKAEEIYFAAVNMKLPEEREAFVKRSCQEDGGLRAMVDKLLASQQEADAFFLEGGLAQLSMAEISEAFTPVPGFSGMAATTLSAAEELGKCVGPYKLLQRLGEGGCGVVYMAEQAKPVRRRVAFKIIKLGMDTKSVIARFEAERQALALMDHPNIARVFDAGSTETGRPYFVMELVRGIKITDYCDQHQLDTRQRLELFIQVCHAIQHAHQKGVVHRDIKPSNTLITIIDGRPVPKVIDFGIAKAIEGRLTDNTIFTAYEQFIGTPAYMSPEQAVMSGVDVDTRSDIYSLGVLLYELLTGRTPFETKELLRSGVEGLRRTLQEKEPQRPSVMVTTLQGSALELTAQSRHAEPLKLVSLLRGDLDWIVIRALEKDRARRYQTANGLAMDVQRYLDNEPVLASPPSRFYRLQKLVRRNKTTFISGTVVVLALLVGMGALAWAFVREREARQKQEELRVEAERARYSEGQLRTEADSRAKIAQAAVFLSRNQLAEADQLLEKIQVPVVEPSLEAANAFRTLGEWNVRQGRWKAAADRFANLVRANQVDKTDKTEVATFDLLRTGPALIAAGETEAYRQLVQDMLSRFRDTKDPVAAEQIIKISLLQPADAPTLQRLQPFAKIVEESMTGKVPEVPVDVYRFAWREFSLSLLDYRRGDFTDAVICGQRCLNSPDNTQSRAAMAHVVLAMAYARLDQSDKSRSELAIAREAIMGKVPDGFGEMPDLGQWDRGFWHDWLIGYILLREAELLVEKPADSAK
jgi:serine/threonine protein kinase